MPSSKQALILFIFIALTVSSCSWQVNLVVANKSDHDILVRYQIPQKAETLRFYEKPKTYLYNRELLKLYKRKAHKLPENIPTDLRVIEETNQFEIRLAPGKAVHVGHYYSFEPRQDVIAQHDLTILSDKYTTLSSTKIHELFRHWKNIHTDMLEIN